MDTCDIYRFNALVDSFQENSKELTTLSLSILAGSLLLILSTDYVRPPRKKARYMYFLFFPAWVFISISVFFGNQITRRVPAYRFAHQDGDKKLYCFKVGEAFDWQLTCFQLSIACFSIWLMFYLVWWIFYSRKTVKK
jgi:hypothetical protein